MRMQEHQFSSVHEATERKIGNLGLTLQVLNEAPEEIQDIFHRAIGQWDALFSAIELLRSRRRVIEAYVRHLLRGLLPNVQVGTQTDNDYSSCYDAINPR